MKLGLFKTIAEPDLPARWLFRNVRVKGYVGEPGGIGATIRRDIDQIFQHACTEVRTALPDGRSTIADSTRFTSDMYNVPVLLPIEELTDENCARIVSVEPLDDYGSLLFKFKYWGIPER